MPHWCFVCGRARAKEKFSGKGHRRHICKECWPRRNDSVPPDPAPHANAGQQDCDEDSSAFQGDLSTASPHDIEATDENDEIPF